MSVLLFVVSAVALGRALQINSGFYDERALAWMTAALVLAALGSVSLRMRTALTPLFDKATWLVLALGLAWQLFSLFVDDPGRYLDAAPDTRTFLPLKVAVVLETILIALGVLRVARTARIWFPAVLVVNVALGTWMIRASPSPWIDVVTVHKEAIKALLDGDDPYRISVENIYGEAATNFYNPAAIFGNRIAISYPYPPVSLLFAVPGSVLLGDYRYSELAALILAAAIIGFAGGATSKLIACLMLTTPRGLFVLEQGWTEPIAIFLLALTIAAWRLHPLVSAWAGGLLIVAKQYLGLGGPAFLRLAFTQPLRRWPLVLGFAALAASAATLPLALWHPNAFMNNVIWLQTREPFRPDSLSFLSWAVRAGLGQGTFWWAIGSALVGLAAGLIVTPNTRAGFAATIALACFSMFAFGSKAFCNYYYFVIGALCCAAAVSTSRDTPTPQPLD